MTDRQYQAHDCKWHQSKADDIVLRRMLVYAEIKNNQQMPIGQSKVI